MQIRIQLPREAEAKSTYDPAAATVHVQPVFCRPTAQQQLANIVVEGAGGNSRRYAITISGKTGRLGLQEIQDVPAAFDGAGPIAEGEDAARE